jgi:hypothetical protein
VKSDRLNKRLAVLEADSGHNCPHYRAVANMTEEELDQGILELLAGGHGRVAGVEHGPRCPSCQKIAAMSEEELDVELARLLEIAEKAVVWDEGR